MDHFKAARIGDLQELRVALTADNVNDTLGGGWTVLHWAARNGHDGCVKYCLEMGANVNARTNGGLPRYTLHFYTGGCAVVGVLLDAGAIVDATQNTGRTPLHRAIDTKRVDVARRRIDRGAKVCNVELDEDVPSIPEWITTFVESRSKCRCAAIAIIGIHKYHRTTVIGNNDINVLRLIAKHIRSTRMDDM
jgi:ankyrin repeat protein